MAFCRASTQESQGVHVRYRRSAFEHCSVTLVLSGLHSLTIDHAKHVCVSCNALICKVIFEVNQVIKLSCY